jgi:anti-sigma factor RsiW
MKWMPTCKEATQLASRAMDARLSFADRLALRVHLAICRNCAQFNLQLREMRRLFRTVADASDDAAALAPDARQRIATELQKGLDP